MRATVIYGSCDVWIDNFPTATIIEPTGTLVVLSRTAISGSLDQVSDDYMAMNDRKAIKTMIEFQEGGYQISNFKAR